VNGPPDDKEDDEDDEDEDDLVRAAIAGDAGAFDRLVGRYTPRLFRMIRAQVRDAVLTEDLVQDTLLRAFVALPAFRRGARFFTWLHRIMTNTVGEHRRRTVRRRALDGLIRPGDEPTEAADAALERGESHERVWSALAELPEEFRSALLLREWEQMSYAQIAQVLDCSVGTVSSRLARARQILAERLGTE